MYRRCRKQLWRCGYLICLTGTGLIIQREYMNNALIIFVRNPEAGKVKTRLASTLGDEKALAIYKELLAHTRKVCSGASAERFVFYAETIPATDEWSGGSFTRMKQAGTDLGQRMMHAFAEVFAQGHEKVLIIGSDCFELTTNIIEDAFELLEKYDTVIGPARDGGYYLLGLKKMNPALFVNKEWSTENVFRQTIHDIEKQLLTYALLPVLTDVDTEADLPPGYL